MQTALHCPLSWTRILLTTTVDEKVSVRAIAKTFASGKTEKLVYQTLAEVGLPSEKARITKQALPPFLFQSKHLYRR